MKRLAVVVLWLQCFFVASAWADDEINRVQVVDPYLDIHTGPAAAYPVTNVVVKGDWVEVIKQRTDWFKIRTEKGKTGWVHRHQLEQTLTPSGQRARFKQVTAADYKRRSWELGFLGGDFEGADLISAYIGLAINRNLSTELSISQALGRYSHSYLGSISLVSQPFPRWRFSPYLSLGAGAIKTKPQTILIQAEDETFNAAHAGFGIRAHFAGQFMIKLEYKNHVLFTSDENNEEVEEWKVGFGAFF